MLGIMLFVTMCIALIWFFGKIGEAKTAFINEITLVEHLIEIAENAEDTNAAWNRYLKLRNRSISWAFYIELTNLADLIIQKNMELITVQLTELAKTNDL